MYDWNHSVFACIVRDFSYFLFHDVLESENGWPQELRVLFGLRRVHLQRVTALVIASAMALAKFACFLQASSCLLLLCPAVFGEKVGVRLLAFRKSSDHGDPTHSRSRTSSSRWERAKMQLVVGALSML